MIAVQKEVINVGMGEIRITKEPEAVLTCVGLGSCIGLCAYDPVAKLGGMIHMVLPDSRNGGAAHNASKYVDTGVPLLFLEMGKLGAVKSRLRVRLAGGARMFTIPGTGELLDVGGRNIRMVSEALGREGISSPVGDVGGDRGRTLQLFIDTGKIYVKRAGEASVEL